MLQCTWRETSKNDPKNPDTKEIVFLMGAATGGHSYVGPKSEYGELKSVKNDWVQSIRRFRFDLLANPASRKVNEEYKWTKAPMYELDAEEKKKKKIPDGEVRAEETQLPEDPGGNTLGFRELCGDLSVSRDFQVRACIRLPGHGGGQNREKRPSTKASGLLRQMCVKLKSD